MCPAETTCSPVTDPDATVCATASQLAACAGLHDHAKCDTDSIPAGRCYSGVCLPVACGNGRVDIADPTDPTDTGEVCDDGNQVSGDGCSADCLSTETCGNGIVDVAAHEQCDDGNLDDHDGCDSSCGLEVAEWEPIAFGGPSKRQNFAMAWDSARGQVVLFGGTDLTSGLVLNDTWIWDSLGWREVTPQASPRPRMGAAMAYDSERHRVVLFGGWAAQKIQYNDTWEWDGAVWIPIITEVSPGPRWEHAMAYDGKNHRTVLYGGRRSFFNPPDYADTWTWNGTAWSQLVTAHTPSTAPLAFAGDGRFATAMAYDPTRGVTVLFGGSSAKNAGVGVISPELCDNHVFELDATDWHEIIPTSGPVARTDAALAYDVSKHAVMLFAGENATPADINDQWEWNGTAWTPLTPASPPAARQDHGMVGDVAHGVVVMFGGAIASSDPATWTWNGTTWTSAFPNIPASILPVVAYDSARSRVVEIDDDGFTFELADAGWATVNSNGPTTLSGSSALAYDPTHAVSVYVGGSPMQTWMWNGGAWTNTMATTEPSLRTGFTTALDPAGDIVLFGGFGTAALGDTWTWDGTSWTMRTPAHSPPARSVYGLAYDPIRKVTVLFGGLDGTNTALADTWTWDGTDWTQMTTAIAPAARSNAPLVWQLNRRRLALVGGNGIAGLADAWEWDGTAWTQLAVPPQPFSRNSPLMFAYRRDGIVMLDGSIQDAWLLHWQGARATDTCDPAYDLDGDTLVGCADPDCWYVCTPECSPGVTGPRCAMPKCGDGVCGPVESCHSCPADCGACTPTCGDGVCDPGETCVGDCS